MAASPEWKVFDAKGVYQAACKEIEAAAALVSFYGAGATIRFDHSKRCTAWTEGSNGHAADSYDRVAEVSYGLRAAYRRDLADKQHVARSRRGVQP